MNFILELLRFAAVGIICTTTDIVLWRLLVAKLSQVKDIQARLFKIKLSVLSLSQIISYSVGVIISYILTKFWVFEAGSQANQAKSVFLFLLVNLTSLLVSIVGIRFLEKYAAFTLDFIKTAKIQSLLQTNQKILIKLLITGFTMLINYFGYKYLAFAG